MNQRRIKPGVKRALIIAAVLLVLFIGAGYGIGSYFVHYALSPESSSGERKVKDATNYKFASEEEEEAIGKAYEQTTSPVSIYSNDGLKLQAKMTRTDSNIWVIVIHGYKGNNSLMMKYGARYAERGYNVLLPDNRAHGESEGKYVGMGWLDKEDIKCWIDWIISQDEKAQILLHGRSMGAATTMMVSGDNPPQVIGYIEDCGYNSVWDIFVSELDKRFSLPSFPVMNLSNLVARWKAGYDFKEASATAQVGKCKKPMLFIHGEDDDFVPVWMGYEVYEAARCEKEFFLVKGAGHSQAELKDPQAYWDKVFEFIDTKML